MNEEQIKALGNAEFFKLFMDALKQTYTEYCEMQAQKEGLVNYSEPMFEFAMSEFERRIVELESELDKAYNDLVNFEGYPEEVSALRHDIERRKQRYINLLHRKAEWKKRAESVERELDDSQRKLSALSYCIKNQISSFYDARSYEEAVNAALVELNKFAIEQQIKAVEYCYKNISDLADSDYVKLKRRAEQLRQQLNGDSHG